MRVLFCASEAHPFVKTGGLADVAGALPVALEAQGIEVSIVMPKYKTVHSPRSTVHGRDVEVAKIGKNILVYLIKNDTYFNREGLYGDSHGDYPDNLERFSFYCKRVLELLKEIQWQPDIVHCHDWQTALIPVYLKNTYSEDTFYNKIKAIFTIHNLGYQGVFPREEYPTLGLDGALFSIDGLEFYHKINLLKGGLLFSDILTTVSPTYAKEILTKKFGCGLEGILHKRQKELFGILNGLDYGYWNPETDTYIAKAYSGKSIEDKAINKEALQEQCGLAVDDRIPLLGVVGRLVEQKGIDLIVESVDSLITHSPLQLVALGKGETKYEKHLEALAKKYPHNVSARFDFDEPLAHKIYAGCDMFLMPSRYEPCGLAQMIALRYGAIPIVFKTGGLADTVSEGNGFVFEHYTEKNFLITVKKALTAYQDKKKWLLLIQKALSYNFSWEVSAREYGKLYQRLCNG